MEFKVEDVEKALLGMIAPAFEDADVSKIVSNDLDADGYLIAPMPAIRVLYDSTSDQAARGTSRLVYETAHTFQILCGARNLRSKADEDTDTKKIVTRMRALLAGAKLALPDGETSEPLMLAGVQRFQFDANGMWYALTVVASSTSQFTGGQQ